MMAFGTGMARMSSEDMSSIKKGLAVKVRWTAPPEPKVPMNGRSRDWTDVLAANKDAMEKKIKEAMDFIGRVYKERSLPTVVSLSGGKDSLATLILTLKAGFRFPIFS